MTALFTTVIILTQDLDPNPQAPPGLAPFASDFLSWLKWGGLVAGIGGLMVCGIMMAAGRRNRSAMAADGAAGIPWNIAGLAVVSLAAGIAGAILT